MTINFKLTWNRILNPETYQFENLEVELEI